MSAGTIIGIDPGLDGALAVLTRDLQLITVLDMPSLKIGKSTRRRVNAPALVDLLAPYAGAMAVCEQPGLRPMQSKQSVETQSIGFGIVLGVLAAAGIGCRIVAPHWWKSKMGIATGAEKEASLALANQMYPSHHALFSRHDRAEAVLIARASVLHGGAL